MVCCPEVKRMLSEASALYRKKGYNELALAVESVVGIYSSLASSSCGSSSQSFGRSLGWNRPI